MADDSGSWLPDPTGRHELRYHDGSDWTDHVADGGVQGQDPWAGPVDHEPATPTGEPGVTSTAVEHGPAGSGARPRAPKRYAAFISYSHAADGAFAPTLQTGLQRLGKSWKQRRALEVFRDETGLSVNPHLWTSICQAMDGSDWFVLLASPDATRSEWVGKEIERWVAERGADRILPVVTEGTWTWDPDAGDFAWDRPESVTAVHPALRGVFQEEPRHMDMSWARSDTDLSLRNPRFRDQIAELAAPLHGKTKDELEGEDIRQQRRTQRLARGAVTVLAALTVTAIIATVLAVVNQREAVAQRDRAEEQARAATSRQLADLSGRVRGPDGSLPYLLAAEAYRKAPTVQAVGAMFGAVTRRDATPAGLDARLVGHSGGVSGAAFDPSSRHVATLDQAGAVRVWALGGSNESTLVVDRGATAIAFDDDGSLVVAADDLTWYDPTGGASEASVGLDGVRPSALAAVGGDAVVVGGQDGSVATISSGGDRRPASTGLGAPVTFLGASDDGDVVVASDQAGEVLVLDGGLAETGRWRAPTEVYALSHDGASLALEGANWRTPRQPPGQGVLPQTQIVDVVAAQDGAARGGLTVFEPYIPRDAAFAPGDAELAAVTTGGVDGAPGLAWIGTYDGAENADSLRAKPATATITVVSPDGRLVLVGGDDPVAYLNTRDVKGEGFGQDVLPEGAEPAEPLSTAPESGLVVVREGDGLGVLDIGTGEIVDLALGPETEGVLTPDGALVLSADGRVADAGTGQVIADWTIPPMELGVGVAFSGDGRRVGYVVDDTRDRVSERYALAVVDLDSRQVFEGTANPGAVDYLAGREYALCVDYCGPDQSFLALDSSGERLAIRPVAEYAQREGDAASPDLLSELGAGPTKVVLVAVDGWSRTAEVTLPGPGPVAFVDDDVVQASDGERVWNLDATDLAPDGSGYIADQEGPWVYSPDDAKLAVASTCEVVLVDPTSWGTVAAVPYNGDQFEGGCNRPEAAWIAGGATLLTVDGCRGTDCPVRRWDVDGDLLFAEACRLAGRNMTRDEWTQFLPEWPYERTCDQYGEPEPPSLPTSPSASSSTTTGSDPTTTTTSPPATAGPPDEPATGGGAPTVAAAVETWLGQNEPGLAPFRGPCSAVPIDDPGGVCFVEPNPSPSDPQRVVVGIGAPYSEIFLYLLLAPTSAGGWEVVDLYAPADEYDTSDAPEWFG